MPKDLDFFGDNSHSKKNLNDKGKSKDVSQLDGNSIDNSVECEFTYAFAFVCFYLDII